MSAFPQFVRPVVEDAAHSIEYATGYPVERVLAWFDSAAPETIQHTIMGAVQDALYDALGIDPEGDYDAPNVEKEKEGGHGS